MKLTKEKYMQIVQRGLQCKQLVTTLNQTIEEHVNEKKKLLEINTKLKLQICKYEDNMTDYKVNLVTKIVDYLFDLN